jgi:hypothetical protein
VVGSTFEGLAQTCCRRRLQSTTQTATRAAKLKVVRLEISERGWDVEESLSTLPGSSASLLRLSLPWSQRCSVSSCRWASLFSVRGLNRVFSEARPHPWRLRDNSTLACRVRLAFFAASNLFSKSLMRALSPDRLSCQELRGQRDNQTPTRTDATASEAYRRLRSSLAEGSDASAPT